MTILNSGTAPQTFKIIPRSTPNAVKIVITDKNLGSSVTYLNNIPTYSYGWMEITETLSLVEGRFYVIEVSALSDVIYRGQIFCTNQTDYSKFQMTSGSFATSNDKDNTIIIL